MNMQQLSRIVARKSRRTAIPLTNPQVEHCLDLLLEAMTEELTHPGGKITFPNFGILEVIEQQSHGGKLRVGNSEELADVPSVRHVIKWKASRRLQMQLRQNANSTHR